MHRLCSRSRRLVTMSRRLQSTLCAPNPRLYPTTAILRSFPNSAMNATSGYERNNQRQTASAGVGHASFEEIPDHEWELVIFDKVRKAFGGGFGLCLRQRLGLLGSVFHAVCRRGVASSATPTRTPFACCLGWDAV